MNHWSLPKQLCKITSNRDAHTQHKPCNWLRENGLYLHYTSSLVIFIMFESSLRWGATQMVRCNVQGWSVRSKHSYFNLLTLWVPEYSSFEPLVSSKATVQNNQQSRCTHATPTLQLAARKWTLSPFCFQLYFNHPILRISDLNLPKSLKLCKM